MSSLAWFGLENKVVIGTEAGRGIESTITL